MNQDSKTVKLKGNNNNNYNNVLKCLLKIIKLHIKCHQRLIF